MFVMYLAVSFCFFAFSPGTLAFIDVEGASMGMKLPRENPPPKGRLLQDLRGLPDGEVCMESGPPVLD